MFGCMRLCAYDAVGQNLPRAFNERKSRCDCGGVQGKCNKKQLEFMSNFIPYLKNATALPGYKMLVEFEDGIQGIIDLQPWKGKGVFSYWNDEVNFRIFKITENKKLWWNEEIDMDPDAFYLKLINKTFEEYASDKQLLRYSH